ncbi:MAG: hypothetical protein U0228_01350 [Myxococcaceae bacterium]
MRALVPFVLLVSALCHAENPSVQECVSSSESAQQAMKQGALTAARPRLERCVDAACPQVVRTDCARWLDEVLAQTPSLNVVVRTNGVDQPEAEVWLDGAVWQARVTGKPKELDPGEHELLVKLGERAVSRKLLVVQGEKNRVIALELPEPTSVTVVNEPVKPPPVEAQQPAPVVVSGTPVGPLVVSALALGGLVSFTAFGVAGKSALDALEQQPCAAAKTCKPSDVQAIRNQFLAADISLGVAGASAIAAGIWWWWWTAHQAPPKVVVLPGLGSLLLALTWP